MACQHISLPGGGAAIVCGSPSRQRCRCGRVATLLCDWKDPSCKSGTCDAPICSACAMSPAPDKDLCRKHARAFEDWRARRAAAVPPVDGVLL